MRKQKQSEKSNFGMTTARMENVELRVYTMPVSSERIKTLNQLLLSITFNR